MDTFEILYIESKKRIEHKRANGSKVEEEIKNSRCIILNKSVEDSINDLKKGDKVDDVLLVAILKLSKIPNEATGMLDINVDIYSVSKFNKDTFEYYEEYLGSISSKISEMDKNLIDIINFGTGISRKEIVQIRKFIMDNVREIPLDKDDLKKKNDFVRSVISYIITHGIASEQIRNKSLYLIDKDKFINKFSDTNLVFYQRYMRKADMIITSGVERFFYRKKDNEYYFAVNADHETIEELYEVIKGKI